MNNQTIVCCVVALLLGMLLANMLKNVCGCKTVEGNYPYEHDSSKEHPSIEDCKECYQPCSNGPMETVGECLGPCREQGCAFDCAYKPGGCHN